MNRRLPPLRARDGGEALDETRRHRGRAGDLGCVAEDDFFRAEELREIVGGQADTALRQIKPEIEPHRTAEPRIGPAFRRPGAFDQAAEHDAVALGEARFDGAENAHPRAGTRRRPHHPVRQRGGEQLDVVGCVDEERGRRLARCQFVERIRKL